MALFPDYLHVHCLTLNYKEFFPASQVISFLVNFAHSQKHRLIVLDRSESVPAADKCYSYNLHFSIDFHV